MNSQVGDGELMAKGYFGLMRGGNSCLTASTKMKVVMDRVKDTRRYTLTRLGKESYVKCRIKEESVSFDFIFKCIVCPF